MNRGYRYSKLSHLHIDTTTDDCQRLCEEAIEIASTRVLHCPDFGISCGLRTPEEQWELYMKGRITSPSGYQISNPAEVVTNCDGILIKSNHQSGNALDFYAYVDGKTNYEPSNLALVATCFFAAAEELGLSIKWGGNFFTMADGPHIEIIKK